MGVPSVQGLTTLERRVEGAGPHSGGHTLVDICHFKPRREVLLTCSYVQPAVISMSDVFMRRFATEYTTCQG